MEEGTNKIVNTLVAQRERVRECLFQNTSGKWNDKSIDPNSIFFFADNLSRTTSNQERDVV